MQAWRPPMGVLLGNTGTVRISTKENAQRTPAAGIAWITRCQGGEGGLPLARQMFAALVAATGAPAEGAAPAFDRDCGLGVPTVALPVPLLFAGLETSDELLLHAFETGDHLVLSTSVPLSKSMLEAKGGAPRVRLAGPLPVTATSVANGQRLGLAIARAGEMLAHLHDAAFPPADKDDSGWTLVAVLGSGVAGALRTFGLCTATTVRDGDQDVTAGELRFARPAGRPEIEPVLAVARRALGPWPEGAAALVASGTCRYSGADGTFTFQCVRDGRFVNRIDSVFPEENSWDGTTSWSTRENHWLHTPAPRDRDRVRSFDLVLSGQWAQALPWCDLRLADDTMPFEGPAVRLYFPESGGTTRVELDPVTMLRARFDFGEDGGTTGHAIALSDWRDVGGRLLPHEVRYEGAREGGFHVQRWQVQAELAAGTFTPPPPPDGAAFAGAPEVEVHHSNTTGFLARGHCGAGAAWFRVDPGFDDTTLSRHRATALGIDHAEKDERIAAPALRFGPATLTGVPLRLPTEAPAATKPTPPAAGSEPRADGTIGYSLFRRCCAEMDYAAPALRLFPPGHFDGREAAWVDTLCDARSNCVPVQLAEDVTLPFQLTFFGGTPLVLLDNVMLEDRMLARRPVEVWGRFSSRLNRLGVRWAAPRIGTTELGKSTGTIPRTRTRGLAITAAGHFGASLVEKDFVLLLDLPRNRVAFVKR